jgi:hypothetical protein
VPIQEQLKKTLEGFFKGMRGVELVGAMYAGRLIR